MFYITTRVLKHAGIEYAIQFIYNNELLVVSNMIANKNFTKERGIIMQEQFKAGDIIIFDAGDDWLGKAICWFTKSTVSHSAIVYEDNKLVEMGAKGIAVSSFSTTPGNKAHLMRLDKELPCEPLVQATKYYVEEEIGYDFPALVLLAGLIIYTEIRPTPRFKNISDLIITGACLALDKLLNGLIQKGKPKKTMVCSQLVYQIYLDCGGEYVIQVRNLLDNSVSLNDASLEAEGKIRISDLIQEYASESQTFSAANIELDYQQNTALDEEELIKELYQSLVETEEETSIDQAIDMNSIIEKAAKFLELIERILDKIQLNIPIPALFITPADLYEHAKNLEKICDFNLERK